MALKVQVSSTWECHLIKDTRQQESHILLLPPTETEKPSTHPAASIFIMETSKVHALQEKRIKSLAFSQSDRHTFPSVGDPSRSKRRRTINKSRDDETVQCRSDIPGNISDYTDGLLPISETADHTQAVHREAKLGTCLSCRILVQTFTPRC